ncbi:phage baseplate assembly protein V [Methylocystis sp. IM3]|jgi:hypothetical protein|uniref:phage baseplate assembly protein V n=1 Tax=unclassified Methylocystis TaxID=2625913 RepID=UPI000FAFFD11|nr:MAG: baseplate assembly protein [Hyphomicrobiales bacterium]
MSRKTMAQLGFVDSMRPDEDEDLPASDAMSGVKRYYGKYRGTVLPTPDPDRRGRLMVEVADRDGPNVTGWARPCLPWAGLQMGSLIVPPPGSKVWVEFEQGLADYPIWVGCWWGSTAEAPTVAKASAPAMPIFALQTLLQHALVVTDTPYPPYLPTGGILIGNATACIAIDATGVRIFGPTVQVNGDPAGAAPAAAALLVTK